MNVFEVERVVQRMFEPINNKMEALRAAVMCLLEAELMPNSYGVEELEAAKRIVEENWPKKGT